APGAVLLQSCTRLLRRSTRPGCEQGLARCSGFTLRTEGGAPTINTRLLRRSTRPGCEQGLARCSGFTLRTEGGAPTINTRFHRRSTRPGCERGDGQSPSQLPTQSVDNSVSSLGATAAGPRHDRL